MKKEDIKKLNEVIKIAKDWHEKHYKEYRDYPNCSMCPFFTVCDVPVAFWKEVNDEKEEN
jgi:hypothetical protein